MFRLFNDFLLFMSFFTVYLVFLILTESHSESPMRLNSLHPMASLLSLMTEEMRLMAFNLIELSESHLFYQFFFFKFRGFFWWGNHANYIVQKLNLVKPGSSVLRTKKVTPDFTKIQLCQMGFSVLSPF